jgi:hypothetical protein
MQRHSHRHATPPRRVIPSIRSPPLPPYLGTRLTFYELDEEFGVAGQREYDLDGFAFLHDFAMTPSYYVVFQNPVTGVCGRCRHRPADCVPRGRHPWGGHSAMCPHSPTLCRPHPSGAQHSLPTLAPAPCSPAPLPFISPPNPSMQSTTCRICWAGSRPQHACAGWRGSRPWCTSSPDPAEQTLRWGPHSVQGMPPLRDPG